MKKEDFSMKKFLSLFIAATLLLSMLFITPVFAEGEPASYAKDTVIQATVLMPEASAFTAIEGKLTYDSTALEYCSGTFEAPNVPGLVFSDKVAGKFTFNTSKIENAFDISEDHVIFKAQFTVLEDDTVPDFTSTIEDVYILNGIQFIDVSKTSVVQISVVSTPSTESTDSSEETQASYESQSTQASESQSTQASESQSVPATESQETQSTEPASARTVYYIDTIGWTDVYAYAYFDTYIEGDLPGTKMTYVGVDDDNNPIYSVEVPADSAFIIFNDGKGTQTPAGTLTDDVRTFFMKDGKLDHYSHVTPTDSQETQASESQETQATESTNADEGYPVTFVTDGHATINVYHTRNYATSAVDENVTTAVSRNRDTGEPDSIDEDAQINFLVVLENGYEIDSVTALPATNYKNLKGSDETLVDNMYRITKVAGELTITVTTKLSATQDTSATESSETTATESSETTATSSSETTATESSETTATSSSETTATESSETQATTPTQAPATTIKVTAAKKTIYVNASTTVKATVTNGIGTTKFKSSNTKVATVTSAGKVTGKKAGSVTITATNNGKSASVKIKIVKRANPMTVKAKAIKASSAKTKSFTKAKAFTVKKAKGTVTFKKTKGDKKITVTKKGKVTVKKGLKKGTYKVKVKVTAKGTVAYNAKSKTVTLKVTVK